jgi:hypothetical protein
MPNIKSLFRSLPASTPTVNYYDWLLGRPDLKKWPDFAFHIDGVTGERRHVHAVLERFEHAAMALAASPSDGGLGLAAGQREIVGILSENCLVRPQPLSLVRLCPAHARSNYRNKGIFGSHVCPPQVSRAVGVRSCALHFT